MTWCVVQHMGGGGRIVNVASRGAFRGEPDQPGYGASKAPQAEMASGTVIDVNGASYLRM